MSAGFLQNRPIFVAIKYDIMKQILIFIAWLLLGCIGGIVLVGLYFVLFTDMSVMAFLDRFQHVHFSRIAGLMCLIVFSSIASFFLQIMLHEGGHLLFGRLTGFRFVSFRIGSFTLLRENGRYRIKRYAIAGTGGQCLMSPPDDGSFAPFAWYNAGGVLVNLGTALAALAWVIIGAGSLPFAVKAFLLMFAFIGLFLGLINGIPMKPGGFPNDGYNMRLAFADKEQMKYLALQLRVNALSQEGTRLKDMPSEWFEEMEVTDYSQLLQVNALAMCASRYADRGDYGQAQMIYAGIMQHKDKLIDLFINEYTCELLYLELVGECRPEEVDRLYTNDIKAYIDQHKKHMPGKQLLACAYALFRENDPDKAKTICHEVIHHKDNYLMQGEVQSAIALMEELFAKAGLLQS